MYVPSPVTSVRRNESKPILCSMCILFYGFRIRQHTDIQAVAHFFLFTYRRQSTCASISCMLSCLYFLICIFCRLLLSRYQWIAIPPLLLSKTLSCILPRPDLLWLTMKQTTSILAWQATRPTPRKVAEIKQALPCLLCLW